MLKKLKIADIVSKLFALPPNLLDFIAPICQLIYESSSIR